MILSLIVQLNVSSPTLTDSKPVYILLMRNFCLAFVSSLDKLLFFTQHSGKKGYGLSSYRLPQYKMCLKVTIIYNLAACMKFLKLSLIAEWKRLNPKHDVEEKKKKNPQF